MGFILSKMNLMILVIAIFAIISYFMLGLGGLLVNRVAHDLVLNNSRDIYGMIFSKTTCDSKLFNLPGSLATSVGSETTGTYYKFIIKKVSSPNAAGMNSISFIVTPAKEPNKVLAADNFKVDADLFFCNSDNDCPSSNDQIELEPQAAPSPRDAFIVIKQVRSGKKNVYFIACSSEGLICKARYTLAAERFFGSNKSFDCSPGGMETNAGAP
jgi:hypothetical protein